MVREREKYKRMWRATMRQIVRSPARWRPNGKRYQRKDWWENNDW